MFVTCVTQEGNICTTTFNMSIHVKRVTLLKKTPATHVTSTMLPTYALNLVNLSLLLLRLACD
ncbi:hypothetical protein HanHA300_Chr06g0215591 [Helianthus annuus]|nr:hypothetical protein HanHA300_Chr06g0215591 [Helianthus annuus]KAJ0573845.1 hypothetical protein HanHA89_Chr06g0231361 [Helianthus annuus]KAJ0738180.1 hypothetical protein HanLR1_Chr06g0215291 [Helianthus annuus]